MGKRNRFARHFKMLNRADGTALGTHSFGKVIEAIDKLGEHVASVVSADYRRSHTSASIIESIYEPAAISALIAARPLTTTYGYSQSHDISIGGVEVQLSGFEAYGMLTPNDKATKQKAPDDLLNLVHDLQEWHIKLAKIEHMLAWMDATKSVPAFRYWWPTVEALAPGCLPVIDPGKRFKHPEGVSQMVPLMKETTEYVAALRLLPPVEDIPKLDMNIEFDGSTLRLENGTEITLHNRKWHF